jgi:putative membrane protein insertion efficiency factor
MKTLMLLLIRGYQLTLSPLLGRHCRFLPTCSAYTYQAVQRFGAGRGAYLGLRRLLKCHPFHAAGHDPVPEIPEVNSLWIQKG